MASFYEKLKLVEYKCSLSGDPCCAFMYIPKILIIIYSEINSCFVLYFAPPREIYNILSKDAQEVTHRSLFPLKRQV